MLRIDPPLSARRGRSGTLAAAALIFVLAAVVYVPIAPAPLELEPDLSLRATTVDAFVRHLQFGKEIVYTYGPWGILQRGYDRRTDAIVLALSAVLAALFAAGVTLLARDAGAGLPATITLGAVAVLLVATAGGDGRFTVLALLLVISTLAPPSLTRELPLAAALALVALIKFSLLIVALFVIAAATLIRRSALHASVFGVTLVVLWLSASQQLRNLPLFLARGSEVALGYAAASAIGSGVPAAAVGVLAFVVVCAAIERDFLRTAVIGGTAILLFKIGYVRADPSHTRVADALLLFLVIAYVLLRLRNVARIAAAAAIAVALVIGIPVFADLVTAMVAWLPHRTQAVAGIEREIAVHADAAEVPQVAGTIDALPWGSAALLARGMQYTPRPVFESYMAWTPKLAELNAEYFRERPPEWLWVGIGSIDGRLPILDDAPSWMEIIRRYEVVSAGRVQVLLRRRTIPRAISVAPLRTAAARFGEEVTLPDTPLWCAIDIDPPLATRLGGILLRPAQATIELIAADGEVLRWRAVVPMLRGGFLLSPMATNPQELAALIDRLGGRRVARLRVLGEGLGETYVLRLSAVSEQPLFRSGG